MLLPPGRVSRCVVLFARTPFEEGRVKGLRGAVPLFALARRRLSRVLAALEDVDVVLAGDGGDGLFPGATVLPQRGRTFGERLSNAFADARGLGYAHVVAVPIDVPALGAGQLAAAFEKLSANEVVLGPCADGGVYLVGSRSDTRALFHGVEWQTDRVFLELLANAGEAVVLGPLLDVDRRADLAALAADPSLDLELKRLLDGLLARPPADRPLSPRASLRRFHGSGSTGRSPPAVSLPV